MEVNLKRLLAFLMTAIILVGMLPVGIFATTQGFSVTVGGSELAATDCGDNNWLLTAPEGTSELSISLNGFSGEYFYLQSPNPKVSNSYYTCNSFGDGDMESFEGYATYDEDAKTYNIDLNMPYIKCTVKDTIEKFGFAMDSTAEYYYISIYDGDTWDLMYNLLIKVGGSGESTVKPVASETPVITKQPVSAEYEQGASAAALTVTAKVSSGTLSYAWYADDSKTVLSTSAQYTPSTETIGSRTYYVVVTNTENGKTAVSVTSQKVTVTVTKAAGQAPEKNDDGVYQIGTKEELFWFAAKVNQAKSVTGGWSDEAFLNAELTADINLEDEPWTPIGKVFYGGHFNGNGFTVSGLNITADSDEDSCIGFFADVEDAAIENLKLSGKITVTGDSTAMAVGGIAGYVYDSTLKKCRADIEIDVESENVSYFGGLIGFIEGEETTLQYCANLGDITSGYVQFAGGLIGYSCCEGNLSISCCYQKGSITTGGDIVGGLIGESDDYALTVEHCYVSASIGDETLPSGLTQTGTITGQLCGDLFGLLGASDITFDRVYTITELIESENNYAISEIDANSYALYTFEGTPEDFLEDLNGSDDTAYTIVEDGDGWPTLAWELEEGASPTEQEKALEEAKQSANDQIIKLFTDTYKEADYEASDWAKMIDYRDKALASIDTAKDQQTISTILTTLKTDLATVSTIADKLDEHKKTACTEIEKAYYHQTTGTGSTLESGYKADLTKYIETAKKFGLMHGFREQLLEDLQGDIKTLESKKNAGIEAVKAATSKAEVDAEKANALSAMEQVLTSAKARKVNNGVADKWDGMTKTMPSGAGTSSSPYRIGTAAELAWFADAVNSGKKNLYATLTADIDLNEKVWTPIAKSFNDANGYSGVFDGNNHKIHGLAVTVEKTGNCFFGGLFGNVGKNGVVKNVAVSGIIKQMLGNTNMTALQKKEYAIGGIAGCSSGIIYHCESSVVLTNGKTYSNCNFFGGIVGYQVGGIIESCTSYAILYKDNSANFQNGFGGVTGCSTGNSLIRYSDSYAELDLGGNILSDIGGITATLSGQAQIRECRNFGTVVNGNGIVGIVADQAGVTYVLNSGTVSGKNGIGESGLRPGAGIIGVLNSSGTVSYIYNIGSCVYGLVNNFKKGTVIHAQSSSQTSLWGTADAQNAFTDDCLKVNKIDQYESTESNGELAWKKLEATLTLLGNLKSTTDATYGSQSTAYNAVVLQLIRKVELAKTAEDVASILASASKELDMVQTQLEAEKESVIAAFEAYVAARVYDENGTTRINALLKKAKTLANDATTLKVLNNIKEEYLGTQEQPGKFETECDTYNTKAKNELYNAFIYEKKYSTSDMATLLSLYEQWAVRIDAARSIAKIDEAFADARFAMNAAAEKMTQVDVAPDMDEVAKAALELAKKAAKKELSELAQSNKASMQTLVDSTNGKGYAKGILTAIQNIKTALNTYMDTTSAVDFTSCTDYAQIENAKNSALASMGEYAAAAQKSVNALIYEAEESSDGTWDGTTVTEPQKDRNGIYQISNAAELAWLAQQINAGHFAKGNVNAILTNDIDLGYNEWTPIGIDIDINAGKLFAGSFDGNGFTIKGLYISKVHSSGYAGLFGVVRNGAVIKNLTVRGTFQLENVGNAKYIGGIVGLVRQENATLSNCTSHVKITVREISNTSGQPSHIGGLVGYVHSYVSHVDITDCTFRGAVTVEKCNANVHGIGGIVGKIEGDTALLRTINYGEITVDKAVGVGGIIGRIDGYGAKAIQITDCANLGNITNDAGNVMDSKGGTGGIVGVIGGIKTTITSCYNTGTITASKIAGGILGLGGTSGHETEVVIESCYNAGTLVGPNNQTASKIGSLVGYPIDGEYKDKLYVLKGSAQAAMGWKSAHGDRIYAVSADELIGQFADGKKIVESIANLNRGYPIFAWQLLDNDNRQAVVDYLNDYFETVIKAFASSKQNAEISKMLKEKSGIILVATDSGTIISAYKAAMAAMDKDLLLNNAKTNARTALVDKIREYLAKYPQIADALATFNNTVKSEIESAQMPSEIDTILDRLDAGVVDLLIADIGQIDNDLTEDEAKTAKEKIALAEEAYNALTGTQKQQVSKFVTLREAKSAMNMYDETYATDKAAAEAVKEMILAIGEVTLNKAEVIEAALNSFDALTDRQKAMVSQEEQNALLSAKEQYNALVAEHNADVKAANKVIALINAIGDVTLDSKDAISSAINAYNALTEAQKEMISEDAVSTMFAASRQYGELVDAYNADIDAVTVVTNEINMIGTVTLDSKTAIADARAAYNALTDSQKEMMPAQTLAILTAAEAQYDALIKADDEKPEPTDPDATNATVAPDDKQNDENTPIATPSEKAFDWSIVLFVCVISVALLVVFGMIRWFMLAMKKRK